MSLLLKNVCTFLGSLVVLATCILPTKIATAFPIPVDIKKTVAFIYAPGGDEKILPNGTGFFIAVSNPKEKDKSVLYLVTAKHVLQQHNKQIFHPFVGLRLNTKAGPAKMLNIPLVTAGQNKNVFTHKDPSVDLAVVSLWVDQSQFDFMAIADSLIVTKDDFANYRIGEGTEVFFTGLFVPYIGKNKNYPVVRFGKFALVTDERIPWNGVETELYLMEAASYGGNSGSPVFFQIGIEAIKPGKLILSGDPMIKLAGIMIGYFNDFQPVKFINTDAIPVASSNIGIAGVTPVHYLQDILSDDEIKQRRGF